MSFDLKSAIGTFAPTLATMLDGPLAGTAVSALTQAFGLSPGAGQDDITKIVQGGNMTPDIIAKVRIADQEHAERLKQMDIDLEKLNQGHVEALEKTAADDRDSARKMQMAKPSYWPGVLSAVTTIAVIGVIGLRMSGMDLPDDSTTVQLIGSLTTGWGMCLAYWFGTTRGSTEKNNLLAQSAPIGKA